MTGEIAFYLLSSSSRQGHNFYFSLSRVLSYLIDGIGLFKDTLDEFLNSDVFIFGVDEFLSVFHNLFVKYRISFVFLLLNFLCIFQILIISNIIELLIFLTRLRGPRKFTNNFSAELL